MALKHEKEKAKTPQEMIEGSCEKYGVDPELAVAIARLETGHFTSEAFLKGNNVGGLSENEIPLSFETIEEGVDRFISNLARNYFAKGLTTPEEISGKYCPGNAGSWAEQVRALM